jgi:hypothetical protein
VAVEKLASEKSAKIKTRQEALQTIFFDDLDIFYPRISICFGKKGVFQRPRLFSTPIRKVVVAQPSNRTPKRQTFSPSDRLSHLPSPNPNS